jgi:hypothetical protein
MNNKYTISIPTVITNKELYLRMISDRIMNNISQFDHNITVKLYALDVDIISGYSLKWSTTINEIYNIQKCLSNFLGMSEQYNENIRNSLLIINEIQFNFVNESSLKLLNEINEEVLDLHDMGNNPISKELYFQTIAHIEYLKKLQAAPIDEEEMNQFTQYVLNKALQRGLITMTTPIPTPETTPPPIQTSKPKSKSTKPKSKSTKSKSKSTKSKSKPTITKLQELEFELNNLLNNNPKPRTPTISKRINHLRAHMRYYRNTHNSG